MAKLGGAAGVPPRAGSPTFAAIQAQMALGRAYREQTAAKRTPLHEVSMNLQAQVAPVARPPTAGGAATGTNTAAQYTGGSAMDAARTQMSMGRAYRQGATETTQQARPPLAGVANKVTNGAGTEEAGRPRSGADAPSPDGAANRSSAPAVSDRGALAPVDAARPGNSGGAPAPAPADGDGDEPSGVGRRRRRQEARSSNDARRIHAQHFSYDWEEGLIGEEGKRMSYGKCSDPDAFQRACKATLAAIPQVTSVEAKRMAKEGGYSIDNPLRLVAQVHTAVIKLVQVLPIKPCKRGASKASL